MKIITFSGVDGAGKSTQAQLLRSSLLQQGKQIEYFHATEFSLANRLLRKEAPFIPGNAPAVTQASFLSVLARLFFLFLDGIRFFFYKQALRARGVDVLIADRFFQDSLINILYLSQNPIIKLKVLFLSWVLPKPNRAFYLSLTQDELRRRGELPEQGSAYVDAKTTLYEAKLKPWRYTVIDASGTIDDVHRTVMSKL